jgi:hypothetical protein
LDFGGGRGAYGTQYERVVILINGWSAGVRGRVAKWVYGNSGRLGDGIPGLGAQVGSDASAEFAASISGLMYQSRRR